MKLKIRLLALTLALIIFAGCLYVNRGYIEYITYNITDKPSSLTMSLDGNQNSRSFIWVTDGSTEESYLYLSKYENQFLSQPYSGSCTSTEYNINIHKVSIKDLEYGVTYYYKLGGNGNYINGEFYVPKNDNTVSFLHLNDAQTKDPNKLNIFRNTVNLSFKNTEFDFIAFGGDLFDSNMYYLQKLPSFEKMNGYTHKCIAQNILPANIPTVYAQGNHEFNTPYLFSNYNNYNSYSSDRLYSYYSFDYNNIHFTVLDSNGAFNEQKEFLEKDLTKSLENGELKWRIVMMHNGPYSTGDHCDDEITKQIADIFPYLFSKYNVDLVLQAHDHIYSKTTGYEWQTDTGKTYYICLGAAGHRYGEDSANEYVSEKYKTTDIPIKIGKITTDSSICKKGSDASLNPDYPMYATAYITNKELVYNAYIVNRNKEELIDQLIIEKR